jgi:hypothetical protein
VGFVEFNLIDVLGHIQSIHDTTRIKLRMWVEWAQSAWGSVIAEVVYLGKNLDESKFKWADSEDAGVVVASKVGKERVCSRSMVEFDLTPLLTTKFQTQETSENRLKLTFRDLTRFQIRLRTEQMSWVKLASKEYYDASKRPTIVFTQVAWIDYFKPFLTVFWTLYYLIIPPLKVPIFGFCLAAFIHKTRKYTWPIMNFIITRALQGQEEEKEKVHPSLSSSSFKSLAIQTSSVPQPTSPALPTPRHLDTSSINKEPDSGLGSNGLESGLLLRGSASARSLPTLAGHGKLDQVVDDLYSGLRRSRRRE